MEFKPHSFSLVLFVLGVPALMGRTTTEANSLVFKASATQCPPGVDLFPDPDHCTKYFHCAHGVPVSRDCPHGLVFLGTLKTCVVAGSEYDTCTPAHPDRECKRHTVDLIPHPLRCQGYYNCSDYVSSFYSNDQPWSRGYEKECPFPKLFDTVRKQCVDYQHVKCGPGRKEAKWRCDYYAYQCQSAMCIPCWVSYPSCVGKSNGIWPVAYALSTPYYIECEDERNLKGRLSCPEGKFFHPELRKCQDW